MYSLSLSMIFKLLELLECKKLNLTVGVMAVNNHSSFMDSIGWQTSAAALDTAMDRVKAEHLIDNVNVTFITVYDNCIESLATGLGAELMSSAKVSCIIGPTCTKTAMPIAAMGAYYNIPIFTWGLVTNSELVDVVRFPTLVNIPPTTDTLAFGVLEVIRYFEWTEFAILAGLGETCPFFKADLMRESDAAGSTTITTVIDIRDESLEGMTKEFVKVKTRARILVLCILDHANMRRRMLLAAFDAGLINNDYVLIFGACMTSAYDITSSNGTMVPAWVDTSPVPDGRDADAKKAFQRAFMIVSSVVTAETHKNFSRDVIQRMQKPPYNCGPECQQPDAAAYADQLYDATYAYFLVLNKTLTNTPEEATNGSAILQNSATSFVGMSGEVVLDAHGRRWPQLSLVTLDDSSQLVLIATMTVSDVEAVSQLANFTSVTSNEAKIWYWFGGKRPIDTPICGYAGNSCPLNFVRDYLWIIIVGTIIIVAAVFAVILALVCSYRQKRAEQERLNMMWRIPFMTLSTLENKRNGQSLLSIQSTPSTTSTKTTIENRKETTKFAFFNYMKDSVAAEKHTMRPMIEFHEFVHLRKIREIEHDNLNKFIGLSIDGPMFYSCWRYCSRGSIEDVIAKAVINMDGFFVYCLMKDIINGLHYIHNSAMRCHGLLTSSCCLVNDRWQVKISRFGLPFLRQLEKKTEKERLYMAPEVLRSDMMNGTPAGDIYSMAIIFSEMITRGSAWNLENRKEEADEIQFLVKRGGRTKLRPELVPADTVDVNASMLELVRNCWEEEPKDRPDIASVRTLLKGMNQGRSDNLMDHVFNILEQYATTLEEEVEERTKELTEQKKKSDLLLYRMLPKQVADKLKLGQSVQPETFDSVTIFFSDVVSFTTLASKCTPLQVVTLLNELYTIFDHIIDENDVYKVETIGDGYLCVSGLPHRNGDEHIKAVSTMSIQLLRALVSFRVPHLPTERVNIRVGMHTGSCVAGVVGLTMPRYCLFGDTVNTASRMESNGKAGQIHLSSEANTLLNDTYPEFKTERRGEVIIKGKGVMETYWLLFE